MTPKLSFSRSTAILAAAAILVALAALMVSRLAAKTAPEPVPEVAASATAPSPGGGAAVLPAPAAAAPAPAAAAPAPAAALHPVVLHVEGVKLAGTPKGTVRARLRANINSAYFDFPAAASADAGPAAFALGAAPQDLGTREIPRAYQYEVYFEMEVGGRETISGAAETLDLSTPGGMASDKLPYREDYKLYRTGHGARAPEPSAVVAFSIREGK